MTIQRIWFCQARLNVAETVTYETEKWLVPEWFQADESVQYTMGWAYSWILALW